jgi:hypothetical protein
MISSEAFVLSLGLLLGSLATGAFKRLPDERWQFLASVPIMKDSSGRWHGLNFTYYGLLTANGLVFGVGLLIVLLGSLHISPTVTVALILAVLLLCLPAAKWVARLVEGKSCTFTVAGAFFVGIFVTPAVLQVFNLALPGIGLRPVPLVPALAAVMIAYTFGEALGRFACISFGCCYGVSISKAHPILQKVLGRRHFVFSGKMKKISYASGMDGMQVVPIQAMTSLVYILAGLAATFLFLKGSFGLAFTVTIAVTQGGVHYLKRCGLTIAATAGYRRIKLWGFWLSFLPSLWFTFFRLRGPSRRISRWVSKRPGIRRWSSSCRVYGG